MKRIGKGTALLAILFAMFFSANSQNHKKIVHAEEDNKSLIGITCDKKEVKPGDIFTIRLDAISQYDDKFYDSFTSKIFMDNYKDISFVSHNVVSPSNVNGIYTDVNNEYIDVREDKNESYYQFSLAFNCDDVLYSTSNKLEMYVTFKVNDDASGDAINFYMKKSRTYDFTYTDGTKEGSGVGGNTVIYSNYASTPISLSINHNAIGGDRPVSVPVGKSKMTLSANKGVVDPGDEFTISLYAISQYSDKYYRNFTARLYIENYNQIEYVGYNVYSPYRPNIIYDDVCNEYIEENDSYGLYQFSLAFNYFDVLYSSSNILEMSVTFKVKDDCNADSINFYFKKSTVAVFDYTDGVKENTSPKGTVSYTEGIDSPLSVSVNLPDPIVPPNDSSSSENISSEMNSQINSETSSVISSNSINSNVSSEVGNVNSEITSEITSSNITSEENNSKDDPTTPIVVGSAVGGTALIAIIALASLAVKTKKIGS